MQVVRTVSYFPAPNRDLWLRIPFQPFRLFGHPICLNAGTNVRRTTGSNCNNGAESSHNRDLICLLHQTVYNPVRSKFHESIFSCYIFFLSYIFRYVWSGLIVVLGIYLNVYSKKHKNLTFADIFNKIKRMLGSRSTDRQYLLDV